VRKNASLGADSIAALEAVCSGPMSAWAHKLSALDIMGDIGNERPYEPPRYTMDSWQQVLEAFLNAGMGGRDDSFLDTGGDSRTTAHVRTNKDLSAANPFHDEVREVLQPLAEAQRAAPFFGPITAKLEEAETNQGAA
jgi:hypothetical protein